MELQNLEPNAPPDEFIQRGYQMFFNPDSARPKDLLRGFGWSNAKFDAARTALDDAVAYHSLCIAEAGKDREWAERLSKKEVA